MELAPLYLPIRKVDNVRHAYLGLEGTILLFGQRQAAIDSEFMIPVELVTISEGLRFEGRRLIAAVLSLLVPLVLCIVLFMLFFRSASIGKMDDSIKWVLAIALLAMPLAGLVAFLILLVMFFFRVQTIRFDIRSGGSVDDASTGMTIEFYRSRKQATEIDSFLEKTRLRQGLVGESLTAPVHRPAGFTKEHSVVPRLAALLWLASLPALLTGKIPLLVLPVAVLIWFGHRQIRCLRQPREYRQAVRRYLRGDYDDAIDLLENLRGRIPEYLPTYFCLAEACIRGGRFDEALEATACLAHDFPDVARHMEADIWLYRRIDERRQPMA